MVECVFIPAKYILEGISTFKQNQHTEASYGYIYEFRNDFNFSRFILFVGNLLFGRTFNCVPHPVFGEVIYICISRMSHVLPRTSKKNRLLGNRLEEDCHRLDEYRKVKLARALLIHSIPLSPEEYELFVGLETDEKNMDRIQRYCEIERKVCEAYTTRCASFIDPEHRERFVIEFRSVLEGFYNREELNQLVFCMANAESMVIQLLVGGDHPIFRRIRNAYLPEIIDFLSVDEGGVKDITYTLFDNGRGDAISKIKRLLGESPD